MAGVGILPELLVALGRLFHCPELDPPPELLAPCRTAHRREVAGGVYGGRWWPPTLVAHHRQQMHSRLARSLIAGSLGRS
eukprot:3537590-Rhodomonas_salina.1